MIVKWSINVIVFFLMLREICGQRRGWHRRRPKSCRTSRDDIGKCVRPWDCWYNEEDLFVHDNVCGYESYTRLYCCPPNEEPGVDTRSGDTDRRIADIRCEEYSRIDPNSRTWDNDIFSSAITLGEKSSTKEFPHMAVLGYGSVSDIQWKCGGSLISNQFVLTAAHCLVSSIGEVKIARLGDLNLKTDVDNAQPQEFTISKRIAHPQYHSNSQYNDIGLLKLDSPVRFTSFVKPACLQTSEILEEQKFIATGWGSVEFAGSNSDVLQKVDLDYFPEDRCKRIFRIERQLQEGVNSTSQLCAGGFEDGRDTCQGDSGGPLQVKISTRPLMYKIVGITSFGKGCGLEKVPGVYTRVSHYVPWIEEVVWS